MAVVRIYLYPIIAIAGVVLFTGREKYNGQYQDGNGE
jgi:hypothetical protein